MKTEEEARTVYVCERCGDRFSNEKMCLEHEKDHKLIDEFKSKHAPRLNVGDIAEYFGTIYKVVDLDIRVDGCVVNGEYIRRAKYFYLLSRAYDKDDEGDLVTESVSDYFDGKEVPVKLIMPAEEAKALYEELDKICCSRSGVTAKEFVRAIEGFI